MKLLIMTGGVNAAKHVKLFLSKSGFITFRLCAKNNYFDARYSFSNPSINLD